MFKHGKLKKFVALIILDGWGIAPTDEDNLIGLASTPQFDKLVEIYPSTVLVNPLAASVLQAPSEDACRLSHFLIGASQIENNLSVLEKRNPLSINSLSRILSENNLKQLYLTDTEKLPQLTHFYHGCYGKLLKGEEQAVIKSDAIKDYSVNPEMNIKNIIKELKKQLETKKFNFITINLPNIDVVAHSGNHEATIHAVEVVDKCLGEIIEIILSWSGEIIITADHGKAEQFSNNEEEAKAHTASKVPFIFVSDNFEGQSFHGVKLVGNDLSSLKSSGSLAGIAPTVLKLLNIKKPEEMVGKSLV